MNVNVKNTRQKEQLSDEKVKDYIRKSQQGDKEARDILVERNIRLVWSVVQRFINRGYDSDDLFQIGSIGLIKSIDKFDLSYDVRF
ncbi:sigma factor, partial [Oceanobacillus massiliensis]